MYAFLADHRAELFPDELFSDLFLSGRGRPSVPADVMASAMILKELEGLSDSTLQSGNPLLENVRGRIHDPCVDVSELLERKQASPVLGVVECRRSFGKSGRLERWCRGQAPDLRGPEGSRIDNWLTWATDLL